MMLSLQVERVVSGPGLFDVALFLAATRGCPSLLAELGALSVENGPERVATLARNHHDKTMGASVDRTAVATSSTSGAIALAAVDVFLTYYGRTLGAAAQTWLAFGGLFIAGGILPKMSWRWSSDGPHNPLLAAYLDQGPKLSDLVSRVPLLLLEDDATGLMGCLYYALNGRHDIGQA